VRRKKKKKSEIKNILFRELTYNRISGTVPSFLAKMTALTQLSLTENNLTGTIPTDIGQLTALKGMYAMTIAYEQQWQR
jgi:hypothetical protein